MRKQIPELIFAEARTAYACGKTKTLKDASTI
jgi:hypothetical protein